MAINPFKINKSPGKEMSFIDHLEALRWHIMRSVIAVVVAGILIFLKIDWIFDTIIRGPIRKDFVSYVGLCNLGHKLGMGDALCMPTVDQELQSTAFSSLFMTSINIAIMGGFILAFPYIFWEFWKFIKPALTKKEINSTRGAIVFVSFFFFTGVLFGYFLLAPFTFSFLSNYTLGTGKVLVVRPTLDDYIENLINIIIGCGVAFQLPVVSFVLTKIGLVTPSFLKNYRKYAIVIILVVAAVITPSPDWMSQMIVTVPLWLLYEFSIFVSARVIKKDAEKERQEWS
jgi:sec-independent protein translocase protein TatC